MFLDGWKELTTTGVTQTASLSGTLGPTTTSPADAFSESSGIITCRPGEIAENLVGLIFTSDDAANNTFGVQIYGVSKIQFPDQPKKLYLPVLLVEGTATIGADTGTGSSQLPSTERFVDTFTISADHTRDDSAQMNGPTDGICELSFDMMGYEWLDIRIGGVTSSKHVRVFRRWISNP